MISKEIPFKNGLPEKQRDLLVKHKEDIKHLQNWMSCQPHLPKISDEHVLLFLHSCFFSLERSKHTVETYFTIRTAVPEMFANRQITLPDMKQALEVSCMGAMPETTAEGYQILLFRLANFDPAKANVTEMMKLFHMFADICISDNGLANGYIVVFDMKGVALGHLTRVSLPMLKRFMVYIQDAHPARLKHVIVMNCVSFMDRVMALLKPFMKSELVNMLKLYTGGAETFADLVPTHLLTEDYGGKAKSLPVLYEEFKHRLETDLVEWFLQEGKIRADENKRVPGDGKTQGQIFGMEGSFRKLSID